MTGQPNDQTNAAAATPTWQAPAPGTSTAFHITSETVLKAAPGTVLQFSVLVAGSGAGTINDCASTASVSTANQIATIPQTVGNYSLTFPCATGIVVVPGSGQALTVVYK